MFANRHTHQRTLGSTQTSSGLTAASHPVALRPHQLQRPRASNHRHAQPWSHAHCTTTPSLLSRVTQARSSQPDSVSISQGAQAFAGDAATAAQGAISSAMPDGRTVYNYRTGTDGSTLSSRSNAGVISIAAPPSPGQAPTTPAGNDTDDQYATKQDTSKQYELFNWNKAWYAVAVLEHLDPAKPTPTQLLGMDLVLWRDSSGMWRAFQDCCPHRLAPLSEGRVDDKTGNLYCNYHGWQFDGTGSCTHIPQLPSEPPLNPNPKRSCVLSFPTTVSEGLLWVWGEAGPQAATEASAAALPTIAPEINEFGDRAYWSSKLFMEEGTYLGRWYQRLCNASYESVKENVFNDPSHDTVLHHGLGGLSRSLAGPGKILDYHMDEKGYTISRLNPTGRTVNDVCIFPSSQRRNFAPKPGMGAGVGYVTPTAAGKCNMMIALLRDPAYAMKPKGLKAWLHAILPPTPEWLRHIEMHSVVDADVAMQHGLDVNSVRTHAGGYMPAIGMDMGPIAFRKWLKKFAGGGPQMTKMNEGLDGFSSVTALPRERLLDRYDSHTKHCKYCSAALKNFQLLHKITSQLFNILAAAAVGVAAVQLVQAGQGLAGAAATSAGFKSASAGLLAGGLGAVAQGVVSQLSLMPAAGVLGVGCLLAWVVSRWSEKMIARFIFVDYDHSHVSKV